MKIVSSLALVVAVGWLCGCSTVPDSQITNVPLHATPVNAGNIARPIMMPKGNTTEFWFAVSGETMGSALPGRLSAYIYPGSCASLGSKPAYDMNDGPNARFYSIGIACSTSGKARRCLSRHFEPAAMPWWCVKIRPMVIKTFSAAI